MELVFSQFILASIHAWRGDFGESFALFEPALERSKSIRNPDRESGIPLMWKGTTVKQTGNTTQFYFASWVVEYHAMAQDFEGMKDLVAIFLMPEETGQRAGEIVIHRALTIAATAVTPPDWDSAETHMLQSLAMAEARGARPDLAITHLRYAELLNKKGDLKQAREQLDQAAVLFREMEMTWWMEQAEALGRTIAIG